MSWKILWKPKPLKFLRKIDKKDASQISKKTKKLKDDPFRYLEHYEDSDLYKLRIGGYRALIDVLFKERIIVIQYLDKRGRIYKR